MGGFESMNLVRHSYLAAVDRTEECDNISSDDGGRSWAAQTASDPEFEARSGLHAVHYRVFLCCSV
jgi:hypothetical protein